MDSPRFSHG
jgi:hypothetical protein